MNQAENEEKPLAKNSETVEKSTEEKSNATEDRPAEEPVKPRRSVISQDIRYATEPDDQDKLLEKYQNYQTSEVNACQLRFLTDHRQKKNFIGRTDGKILEERSARETPFGFLLQTIKRNWTNSAKRSTSFFE